MTGKRGLIIGGVVLLQLMLLVAAFSLGIYVERYGLSRDGLSYQGGPGGGPPGAGAPGGGPGQPGGIPGGQPGGQAQPGLPPGLDEPPDVIGRLVGMSADALELATPNGVRSILIDENTVYRTAEGQTLTLADLQQGMILAVLGELDPNTHNLLAAEIVVLPPPPDQGQGGQPGGQPGSGPQPGQGQP